jgi:hypothetical protein
VSDGEPLSSLNKHLGQFLQRKAVDPANARVHMQEFFSAVEKEYGESGAHHAALMATVLVERAPNMNINISNSTVGNLNLGEQIGNINTAVHILAATNDERAKDVAEALKQLTEAISVAPQLSPAQKKENLELLSALATEAQKPQEQRAFGVVKSVVAGLGSALSTAGTLSDLWTKWGPAITVFFGLG